MKRRIIALAMSIIMAVSLLPVPALASGTAQWITVPGIEGGKVLFNTETGTIEDCEETVTVANIPSKIGTVQVTTIGEEAFRYCEELISVVLPNCITSVGKFAFAECSNLVEVKLSNNVSCIEKGTFSLCFALKNIDLPDSLNGIRYSAFWGCTGMEEISIPSNVSYINSHAFWFCESLTDIYYGGSREAWDAITRGMNGFCEGGKTPTMTIHCGETSDQRMCKISLYCSADEGGGAGGIAIGGGAYPEGTIVTVTAIPDRGYQFDGWVSGNEIVSENANYRFVASGDTSLGTKFSRIVSYTLTFNSAGGSTIRSITVQPKEVIDLTKYKPTKDGYVFDGWYKNNTSTERLTSVTLSGDATVYARWIEDAPQVKPGLNNFQRQYMYTNGQFSDVPASEWFAESVRGAYELGLVKGTSNTTFTPDGNVKIAETIALACRLHSIYYTGDENFVQGEPWYQVYVDYAINNGIIRQGQFTNYDVAATRAQFATILESAFPHEALPAINNITAIPDVTKSVSYGDAIYRLYNAGVLTGSDEYGTFNPDNTIRRSEVAAIVSRMADTSLRKYFSLVDQGGNNDNQGGVTTPSFTESEYYALAQAACEQAKKGLAYPHSFDLVTAEAGVFDGEIAVYFSYFGMNAQGERDWYIKIFTYTPSGRVSTFTPWLTDIEFISSYKLDVSRIG